MSAAAALVWLSPSVCSEVASEADAVLSRWAATWGLPAPGSTRCEPLPAGGTAAEEFVDLRTAPPIEWKKALSQALFRFDVTGSAVIDAVVQKVAQALAQRLGTVFSAGAADGDRHGPLGHRGVQVTLDLLGLRCGFVLTCAQVRACGRLVVPLPSSIARVNLEQALAEVPVALIAELGSAEIGLDELLQLAPGDVLVLRETLDAPLRVMAPGNALELPAHLGALSDPPQRAVRCLAS